MADHMHGGGHDEGEPQGPWVGGWLLSAVAGLIAAIMARFVGDVGFAATLLVAVLVFLVFGVLLGLFWSYPVVAHDDHAGHDAAPAHPAPVAPVASVPPLTPVAEVAPLAPVAAVEPLAAAVSLAPLAAVAEAEPVELSEPLPPAEPLVPTETIATLAEEEPLEPLEPVPAQEPLPVLEPVPTQPVAAGSQKPQGLAAPRGGKADDLQILEGIGPVLERLCHELGIYHFDQIAGWGPAEVAWMDANLKGFRGRVTRDRWVAQAKLIGAEGVQAFLIRAKTNDY